MNMEESAQREECHVVDALTLQDLKHQTSNIDQALHPPLLFFPCLFC